jgi:hypothetical protein
MKQKKQSLIVAGLRLAWASSPYSGIINGSKKKSRRSSTTERTHATSSREGVVKVYVLHGVLYPQVHDNGFLKKRGRERERGKLLQYM